MKKNITNHSKSALDIFYRVLSNCSIHCLFRLAKYLSFIIAHTKNKHLILTRQNIKLCRPKLSSVEQNKLVKDSLHHMSCAFLELAILWQQPVNEVLKLIKTEQIDESFYEKNKSKIIIAPHHGSWELLNLWLADKGQLYSLYKPAKSENTDRYIYNKRTRNNALLVPANTSGLRRLLQGLKSNKANCMILPDQRPAQGTAQIDAEFYHHTVKTSLLIKRLVSKIDCNIYIASITRNLQTAEYNLTLQALNRSEFLNDDLHSANYLNECIQDLIQNNISQYQWAYRRFPKKLYQNI